MRILELKLVPSYAINSIAIEIRSSSDSKIYCSSTTVSSSLAIHKAKEIALEDHCRAFASLCVKEAIEKGEI